MQPSADIQTEGIETDTGNTQVIHTQTIDTCSLCDEPGEALYTDLADVLFGVPDHWSLMQCASCELTWLYNRPVLEDIPTTTPILNSPEVSIGLNGGYGKASFHR